MSIVGLFKENAFLLRSCRSSSTIINSACGHPGLFDYDHLCDRPCGGHLCGDGMEGKVGIPVCGGCQTYQPFENLLFVYNMQWK